MPPLPFIIGGKHISDIEVRRVMNPFNDSLVGEVYLSNETNSYYAILQALEGFEDTKRIPAYERSNILFFIAEEVKRQKEELAQLITAEVGKPIQYSRIEVDRAVLTFQIAAEETKRIVGEVLPLDLASSSINRFGIVRRFPIGIVLAITPFNYPLNLVAHKIAPAIAAGNSFILKPAPQAPITSLRLAEIIMASGFPRKAINVLPCSNETAELLVRDERIALVSFTGSASVGWFIKSISGKKKIILELGGNAGVIIDKAADINDAIKKNIIGAFGSSGQVCIKAQRIYLHREIFDEYSSKFVESAKRIKCGDPMEQDTVVGPLISDAAVKRIEKWINEAISNGAKVLLQGVRNGRILSPTILSDVTPEMKIFNEEVFGPVVTLHSYESFEEAVKQVNNTKYGLQSGIFSNDFQNILYAFNHLETGAVVVNDNPTYRIDHMPYGGIKDSGFGREGLKYAIEQMTEPKLLVLGVGG